MNPCRTLTLTFLTFSATLAGAAEKPNIVLFMADDMGMGDTSAFQDFTGNADDVQVATPNMERLARKGVRFTDAHTPSSRCSPTRYGLLTGRYPWRNRLKHWVLFGAQGDPLGRINAGEAACGRRRGRRSDGLRRGAGPGRRPRRSRRW